MSQKSIQEEPKVNFPELMICLTETVWACLRELYPQGGEPRSFAELPVPYQAVIYKRVVGALGLNGRLAEAYSIMFRFSEARRAEGIDLYTESGQRIRSERSESQLTRRSQAY